METAEGVAARIRNRRPTSTRENAPLKSEAIAEIVDALPTLGIKIRTDDAHQFEPSRVTPRSSTA
jgi:hypothetical protein